MNSKYISLFSLLLGLCLLFFSFSFVFAQDAVIQFENPLACDDIGSCLRLIADQLNPIAMVVFPAIIVIGGIMYMTSAGSTERLRKAHQTLIWASVGYAVILLADFIQNVVQALTGGAPSAGVTNKIVSILSNIANLLFKTGIVLLPLIILLGAWTLMTSAGEPEKVKKGKQLIIWGCIGLAVILAYPIFGKTIVNILSGG